MATPVKNKPDGLLGLTISDARVLILGMICTDGSGKVDNDKLAVKGGWKNAASASTTYRNAKRKLADLEITNEEGPATPVQATASSTEPVSTPKRSKGRPPKKAATDDSTPAADQATPKPKRQKKTPSKTPVKAETDSNDEDDAFVKTEPSTPSPTEPAGHGSRSFTPINDKSKKIKSEESEASEFTQLSDFPEDFEERIEDIDVVKEFEAMEAERQKMDKVKKELSE